jgi:hypothetical protein
MFVMIYIHYAKLKVTSITEQDKHRLQESLLQQQNNDPSHFPSSAIQC